METLKKVAKIAVPIALVAMPLLTLAALPNPTTPVSGNALTLTEIQNIINTIATFLIVVSIVIAVIAIIWGAVVLITAGGSEERTKAGKSYIYKGIIGAAVVFAIGVILQTVSGLIARTFFG